MGSQIYTQIQTQKLFERFDFFTTSIYELNDLRGVISPGERFVIRQGDLLVTNYVIPRYNERGLVRAYLKNISKYFVFRESHLIIPMADSTMIFHNEHGLIIIPQRFESLHFYSFRDSYD